MLYDEYSSEDFLNFVQSKLNPEFVQLETAQLPAFPKFIGLTSFTNHVAILCNCKSYEQRLFYMLYANKERLCCDESFYEPDFDCRIQEETDSAGNGPEIAWRILRLI